MRILKFTGDDLGKKRFEYCLHGLIIEGNRNGNKGISVLKREISLLDKLENISQPCDCGKIIPGTKEKDRELLVTLENGVTSFIEITDEEFDLLYIYIGNVPWSIGESSRNAIATMEWIRTS